jgi:hypothetical protein
MAKPQLVEIDYEQHKTEADTDNAYLFVINGNDEWVPKSICEIDTGSRQITVPEWFAKDNELI